MSDTEFDPMKDARELAMLCPVGPGRKLTFEQKCGAYCALYCGIAPSVVSEHFSISLTSLSHLAGCRNDHRPKTVTLEVEGYSEIHPSPSLTVRRSPNRKPRYQDVARAFDHLGEREFFRRYYTRQVSLSLRNIMMENGLIR